MLLTSTHSRRLRPGLERRRLEPVERVLLARFQRSHRLQSRGELNRYLVQLAVNCGAQARKRQKRFGIHAEKRRKPNDRPGAPHRPCRPPTSVETPSSASAIRSTHASSRRADANPRPVDWILDGIAHGSPIWNASISDCPPCAFMPHLRDPQLRCVLCDF